MAIPWQQVPHQPDSCLHAACAAPKMICLMRSSWELMVILWALAKFHMGINGINDDFMAINNILMDFNGIELGYIGINGACMGI